MLLTASVDVRLVSATIFDRTFIACNDHSLNRTRNGVGRKGFQARTALFPGEPSHGCVSLCYQFPLHWVLATLYSARSSRTYCLHFTHLPCCIPAPPPPTFHPLAERTSSSIDVETRIPRCSNVPVRSKLRSCTLSAGCIYSSLRSCPSILSPHSVAGNTVWNSIREQQGSSSPVFHSRTTDKEVCVILSGQEEDEEIDHCGPFLLLTRVCTPELIADTGSIFQRISALYACYTYAPLKSPRYTPYLARHSEDEQTTIPALLLPGSVFGAYLSVRLGSSNLPPTETQDP